MPQGSPVPTGFIAPRQCRSPHKPHDALCDNCARILTLPTGAGASAFADAAVPRDDADHSVSAASTLVTLSTGAPMDLDLPPMNLDMPPPIASADTTISVVDDDQLTPRGKRKRREERANQTKHYSGGSRAKIARTLLVDFTHTDNGLDITVLPHEHRPSTHFVQIALPRKGNDTAGERTMRNRASTMKAVRSLTSSLEAAADDVKYKNESTLIDVRERRKCSACKAYIAKNSPDKERCKCKTR
jgi:hypothetical protein